MINGSALGHYYMKEYGDDEPYRQSGDIDYRIELIPHEGNPLHDQELQDEFSELEINCIGGCQDIPVLEDMPACDTVDGLENLTVFVPPVEVFVFSKLNIASEQKNRHKDIVDLTDFPFLDFCDADALFEIIEEVARYSMALQNPNINLHQLPEFVKYRRVFVSRNAVENSIVFYEPEQIKEWIDDVVY